MISAAALVWRHRPGHPTDDAPPTFPERATWGAVGPADWRTRPIDEPWAHAEGLGEHDDAFDADDDDAEDDADADDVPAHDAGSGTDDEAPPPPA